MTSEYPVVTIKQRARSRGIDLAAVSFGFDPFPVHAVAREPRTRKRKLTVRVTWRDFITKFHPRDRKRARIDFA